MLIVSRFGDWLREGLRRFSAYHIMHAIDISPPLPRCKQPRERVGQAMLERRHHDTTSGARHTLHVTQHERRGDRVRLARASSSHDDRSLRADVLRKQLRLVGTAETGGLTTASFISLDSMLPFLRRTGSVPLCRCTNHWRR